MPDTDFGTTLLALARAAIAHRLGRGPAPVVPDDPRLREKGATFITLPGTASCAAASAACGVRASSART